MGSCRGRQDAPGGHHIGVQTRLRMIGAVEQCDLFCTCRRPKTSAKLELTKFVRRRVVVSSQLRRILRTRCGGKEPSWMCTANAILEVL